MSCNRDTGNTHLEPTYRRTKKERTKEKNCEKMFIKPV